MYGQSFGLYALSEYYRATGDEDAKARAVDLFDLFETEADDAENGGYVEYFEPDWSPKESGETALDPTIKLMNTHLHLLEAVTTFYRATGVEKSREWLWELLVLLTDTVVRKDLMACTNKYSRQWEALLDEEEFRIVSYGHDIENVWLAMEACDALDVPTTLLTELFESLWDYTLEYGYDEENGGVYFFGPFDEPATNPIKAWWVQAEALTSALKMYNLTGRQRYLSVFTETYDFLDEYQVDWDDGEWYSGVNEDLEPVGRKGAIYKGAYHNGRAMLECLEELKKL